jgi:hypothetical protein
MIPKKYNEIYKNLAEDLDIDKNFIADCIEFYYADLRSTLTDLEYLRIYVPGLGNFNIKKGVVERDLKKFKSILEKNNTYTLGGYQYHKRLKGVLGRLEELKIKLSKELEELEEFKKNKKND